MLDLFSQDLRFAFRQLRANPGFTAVTILVLALGIGANAAVFAVVNTVLLRPLPFPEASRLVQVWGSNPSRGQVQDTVSPYDFLEWQKQSKSLTEMAVYEYENLSLTTRRVPERMAAAFVSSSFFRVFQVHPKLGRTFLSEEDRPGSRSVVLSFKGWASHFNYDPNIVGKFITLDGEPFTVVGVMPAEFRFPALVTDLWATPAFDLTSSSGANHYLFGVGRLRPGVALGQARSEMSTIAQGLERQYPDRDRGAGVVLVQLQEQMVGSFKRALLLLWGAVALVLLIACANVAHLLLARSVARQKEFAIRTALGAGRLRLIGQLLTESSILAVAGGVIGLALSLLGVHLLLAAGGRIVPRTKGIHIDQQVIAFTSLASLLTALIFGLVPAFRSSRLDVGSAMRDSGSKLLLGGSYGLRRVLIISELALSVMLLIGACLLIKSFWQLRRVDPGFNAANVLGMRISVAPSQYADERQRAVLYQQMLDRIQALPGVEGAAATNDLPFSGSRTSTSFDIEGLPLAAGESRNSDYRTVSSGYFNVMGIPLVRGRLLRYEDDRRETPGVVVINEALQRRYWPHANPIGQRLILHGKRYEIVGVVGNVRHNNLTAVGSVELYVPQYQGKTPPWTFIAIRSQVALGSLIPAVRGALHEVAATQPVYDTRTMQERLSNSIAPQRFNALILAVFASFALILATIGIYGVVSFAAQQRTHEMGIRLAVGAQPRDILRLVVGQGFTLGLMGVGTGVVGALAMARVVAGMLYNTGGADPLTFFAVSAVFLGVAALASYFPARGASRVEPIIALRCE